MKKILFLVSLLSVLGIDGASARTWSFSDCVDYARTHNITLLKTELAGRTAAIGLDEAKGAWQPTLDFATSQQYGNYPWGDPNHNSYNGSYSLNASWTVWDGGARQASIRRSGLENEIADLNTGEQYRSLERQLLEVYLNILYARESIAIYEEAVKLSEAQERRMYALWQSGKASRVDYSQLKSQYEQDRYALVNARGVYDSRRMELKKILEIGLDDNFEISGITWDDELLLAELPDMTDSYLLAIDNDLQLRGLQLSCDVADEDIRIARAGNMPRVSLSGSVGTGSSYPGLSFGSSMKRNFGEQLGLTLSLPIFDARKTKSAVAKAKVQKLNADLDIESRRTELAQLVENCYIDTRSAQSRYTAAIEQQEAARLSAELTNEQFELGLINPVELMTAHNTLVEARHTVLQARFMTLLGLKLIEYYRTATVSL